VTYPHALHEQVDITEAESTDADNIATFLQLSYAGCYGHELTGSSNVFFSDSFKSHLHDYVSARISARDSILWKAQAGTAIIGTIGLNLLSSTEAEIASFYVDTHWQERGIGGLLWKAMTERKGISEITRLHLIVEEHLNPAIDFYEQAGFERKRQVTRQIPTTNDPSYVLGYWLMEKSET
jgi:ribosomal protein S18 acetylase RimI-like enzyme